MGENKRKKSTTQKFLELNPYCCFCGGEVQATTRDHYPPKALFYNKDRPDGLVFPACKECNNGSRHSDSIVSYLALASLTNKENNINSETLKRIKALEKNCPKTYNLLRKSNHGMIQKEKSLRKKGFNYKVLNIHNHIRQHILLFSKKMTCAAYYAQNNEILPTTACGTVYIQTIMDVINEQVLSINLGNIYTLIQGQNNKKNEFSFQIQSNRDEGIGVVRFVLQKQFIITIIFAKDLKAYQILSDNFDKAEQNFIFFQEIVEPDEKYIPSLEDKIVNIQYKYS